MPCSPKARCRCRCSSSASMCSSRRRRSSPLSEIELQAEIRHDVVAWATGVLDVGAERCEQRQVLRQLRARADVEDELVPFAIARLVVQFGHQLDPLADLVADIHAAKPAVACMGECAADVEACIERAEIALHLYRPQPC